MTEITKRILSSFLLLSLLYFAILYKSILFILLIFIYYEIFSEFYFIFKKILKKKNKFIFNFTCSFIIFIFLNIYNLVIFSNKFK